MEIVVHSKSSPAVPSSRGIWWD